MVQNTLVTKSIPVLQRMGKYDSTHVLGGDAGVESQVDAQPLLVFVKYLLWVELNPKDRVLLVLDDGHVLLLVLLVESQGVKLG